MSLEVEKPESMKTLKKNHIDKKESSIQIFGGLGNHMIFVSRKMIWYELPKNLKQEY